MTNIQHKDIPNAQLHETKGASTSTVGQILTSTGGASGWADPVDQVASMTIERLLDTSSTASTQLPSGLDTPQQIEFGAAQSNDYVSLSAVGALTINTAGLYRLKVNAEIGRTGGSGTSHIFLRALLNGTQAGRSVAYLVSNADDNKSFTDEAWLDLPAGAVITYEIMRDNAGNNSGGLYAASATTLAWNDAPTAALRVERFV